MNRNYVKKMLLIVALVLVLPSLAGAMEVWDFVIFCGTATPAELQEMMDVPGFKVNVSDEYGCTLYFARGKSPDLQSFFPRRGVGNFYPPWRIRDSLTRLLGPSKSSRCP